METKHKAKQNVTTYADCIHNIQPLSDQRTFNHVKTKKKLKKYEIAKLQHKVYIK